MLALLAVAMLGMLPVAFAIAAAAGGTTYAVQVSACHPSSYQSWGRTHTEARCAVGWTDPTGAAHRDVATFAGGTRDGDERDILVDDNEITTPGLRGWAYAAAALSVLASVAAAYLAGRPHLADPRVRPRTRHSEGVS